MIALPKVYVLLRPQLDHASIVKFLKDEGVQWLGSPDATPAEQLIEVCGRLCYMSYGKSPRNNFEFIRNLIESGHESVLEHACWTFMLTGVSRAFTHQLVRHRVGFSFSQLSQQYHDEAEAKFISPFDPVVCPRASRIWLSHMEASREAYRLLSNAIKEDLGEPSTTLSRKEYNRALRAGARSVLPNATETKVAITANARALRHFLSVRGSIPGDLEMRLVAAAFLDILKIEAPTTFADFRVDKMEDDSPIVTQTKSRTATI